MMQPGKPEDLRRRTDLIKEKCRQLGFDDCGVVPAEELKSEEERFYKWLKAGFHGEMAYMERNIDKRLNPALLVPGAKSVIVALMNYYPAQKLDLKYYKISKYAWGQDYHGVIKRRLWQLLEFIDREIAPCSGRAFSDSAPLLEQALAVRAGLGWIGKNSLLITKKGSYFFLGELVVDMELAYDVPFTRNFCGTCSACIDACPVNAIVSPGTVDARKCISYLTIEKRGDFTEPVDLHGWVFGCDECQDSCPWNRKAVATTIPEFEPGRELAGLTDVQLESIDKSQFKKIFKGTPVERTRYEGLVRNIRAQRFYPVSRQSVR